MPFTHKYQQHNFENGFQTHNSILDTVNYDPEVIFIGTYKALACFMGVVLTTG